MLRTWFAGNTCVCTHTHTTHERSFEEGEMRFGTKWCVRWYGISFAHVRLSLHTLPRSHIQTHTHTLLPFRLSAPFTKRTSLPSLLHHSREWMKAPAPLRTTQMGDWFLLRIEAFANNPNTQISVSSFFICVLFIDYEFMTMNEHIVYYCEWWLITSHFIHFDFVLSCLGYFFYFTTSSVNPTIYVEIPMQTTENAKRIQSYYRYTDIVPTERVILPTTTTATTSTMAKQKWFSSQQTKYM